MFPEVWKNVLLCDGDLCDTIIAVNTEPSGNIIMKNRDLVLYHSHIGIHTGDKK